MLSYRCESEGCDWDHKVMAQPSSTQESFTPSLSPSPLQGLIGLWGKKPAPAWAFLPAYTKCFFLPWWLKGPFISTGFIEVVFIPHWLTCNFKIRALCFECFIFLPLGENIYRGMLSELNTQKCKGETFYP